MNGEDITGSFYEKELHSTNQQIFRIEKIIKRKGNKLYVKWKGYDDSFNSWINKKDILQKRVSIFLSHKVMKKILKLRLMLVIMRQRKILKMLRM